MMAMNRCLEPSLTKPLVFKLKACFPDISREDTIKFEIVIVPCFCSILKI